MLELGPEFPLKRLSFVILMTKKRGQLVDVALQLVRGVTRNFDAVSTTSQLLSRIDKEVRGT